MKAQKSVTSTAPSTRQAAADASVEAAFDDVVAESQAIELPHRAAMESFFGEDFDSVHAFVDGSGGLGSMGADAAASGETVVFPTPNPPPALVAHELTHVVQARGGNGDAGATEGGSGVAAASGHAEAQAQASESAFNSGAPHAGPIGGGVGAAVAFSGTTGTPLERIREVANGGYMSGPNIANAVRIINEMGQNDRVALANDHTTMGKLARGCDGTTIIAFMNAMGSTIDLPWKCYWIVISGQAGSVGLGAWQTLWMAHDDAQQLATLNWSSFSMIRPHLGNPAVLFAGKRAAPGWGAFLAASAPLVQWLAASLDAQGVLAEVTSLNVSDGDLPGLVTAMKTAGVWGTMTANLPRGSALNEASRRGMKRIAWAVGMPDAGTLFSIRFNVNLTVSGVAAWTIDDLKVVWSQLETLPGQDVSENTVLQTFQAISGDQGFWAGGNTVQLGQGLRTSQFFQIGDARNNTMVNPDRLPHTVRHEIGHAVHDLLKSRVDSWLQSGVGFWYYSTGTAGVESMIADLGGWPAKYKNLKDEDADFEDADKDRIKQLILDHSGNQTWGPNGGNPLPVGGSVARSATADPAATTQA